MLYETSRKSSKIAIGTNRPLQQAVDGLRSNYHSTTHPATGVVPDSMLFQGWGIYNSTFPPAPGATKQVIEEAKYKKPRGNKTPVSESTYHNGVNIPTLFKTMKR